MALEFDPVHAIVEAVQALESDGRRILLVGAFARELTFDRALGSRPYRATRDVDAGVEVASWEAYDSLATRLVMNTRFHRLEPDGLTFVHEDGTQLDLLPFGGILDRSGLLRWPRNPSRTLSLHGFEAADESAIVVHIGNIVVRVAALPNLVGLKLIAYRDRSQRTSWGKTCDERWARPRRHRWRRSSTPRSCARLITWRWDARSDRATSTVPSRDSRLFVLACSTRRTTRSPLQVDVGLGNVNIPNAELVGFPVLPGGPRSGSVGTTNSQPSPAGSITAAHPSRQRPRP